MKVQVFNAEIIESGTLNVSERDVINFIFDEVNPSIKIDVMFTNDNLDTSSRLAITNPNQNHAVLNLFNFNNQLGTGSTTPIHMLNLNGKKVYLRFLCYSLKGKEHGSVKTFHYTWFRGENV